MYKLGDIVRLEDHISGKKLTVEITTFDELPRSCENIGSMLDEASMERFSIYRDMTTRLDYAISEDELEESIKMNCKRIYESSNINIDDDAYKVIDYVNSEILNYGYFFDGSKGLAKLKNDIFTLTSEIEDILVDMAETEFEYLGSEPLSKLDELSSKLKKLADWQSNSEDENFIKGIAEAIHSKVSAQQQTLLNRDYQNGRDPELDEEDDEPKFDIYCTYEDSSNGEQDGDPRYEGVRFSNLIETVKEIKDDFLNGQLRGSYIWSPIDHYTDDDDIEGITTSKYNELKSRGADGECEINILKIYIEPSYGTEDDYKIVINGAGRILTDNLGVK